MVGHLGGGGTTGGARGRSDPRSTCRAPTQALARAALGGGPRSEGGKRGSIARGVAAAEADEAASGSSAEGSNGKRADRAAAGAAGRE